MLGPVLSIRVQPSLIFSIGRFLPSKHGLSEGITNCLELRFIDVIITGYELILEGGLRVGADKGGYNGMTLGFTVG